VLSFFLNVFKFSDTGRYDKHLIFFFLNVLLVIIGYSTRGLSFQVVKFLRIALLGISLQYLLMHVKRPRYLAFGLKHWVLWCFVLLNSFVMVFSVNFTTSLIRFLTWLPFLLYINYFIAYLVKVYNSEEIKIRLLQIFNFAYGYPLAIILVSASGLSSNIYSQTIGGFKTNVLGWSASFFFVTGLDVFANAKLPKHYKYLLLLGIVFALYLVYISGSRSSYLCLAITFIIIVFNSGKLGLISKFFISCLVVGSTIYMLQDENSAINNRIQKTEAQLENGESRFEMAQVAIETMFNNPKTLVTGFGFDSFREGILHYSGIKFKLPSHNSYLELLSTTGIFTFAFFFIFVVINGIFKYLIYDIRRFVFFPTIMIIPFFESNLNAGQFLFFPWMFFLFFYVHYNSKQVLLPTPEISLKKEEGKKPVFFHLQGM
jgi:hypothetical protein